MADDLTIVVSAEGLIGLPEAVRERHGWKAGTRLVFEECDEGVMLKTAAVFAATRPEDVHGMLEYNGKPKTIEEMNAGIEAEVRRRHARGRY